MLRHLLRPTISLVFAVTALGASATLTLAEETAFTGSPSSDVAASRAAHPPADGTRVIGGIEADPGEYPFQVALMTTENLTGEAESQWNAQFCGGTLIAPTWVLTAGHCVRDEQGYVITPESVTVLTGTSDLMSGGNRVAVKNVFLNEEYDPTYLDHDVALLELAQPSDIAPVKLNFDAYMGDATVVGWGMDANQEYPRNLMKTDIHVVGNDVCNGGIKGMYAAELKPQIVDLAAQYRIGEDVANKVGEELAASLEDPLTATMLCAGVQSGARDSCFGDSGGPLIAMAGGTPEQVGIVSWGASPSGSDPTCGVKDVYGVYGRVASFKDWITSHTGL